MPRGHKSEINRLRDQEKSWRQVAERCTARAAQLRAEGKNGEAADAVTEAARYTGWANDAKAKRERLKRE